MSKHVTTLEVVATHLVAIRSEQNRILLCGLDDNLCHPFVLSLTPQAADAIPAKVNDSMICLRSLQGGPSAKCLRHCFLQFIS